MRHGSLFSGIGGFDLAAQWMGWENIFQVEWNSYCQKVLAKNFPNVKRYGDIKEFDGTKYRGLIDIISGGFPCQPYSLAGKQKGKADDRHLWPEMLRIIGEIHPSWVVPENVPGIINWSGGLVFNEVQDDLENKGYEVCPIILPAVGRGAIHRRRRVWFVAYSASNGCKGRHKETGGTQRQSEQRWMQQSSGGSSFNAYTNSKRLQGNSSEPQTRRNINGFAEIVSGGNYPSEPSLCRTNDGIPNRVDRIKSLGNAIVPQVAYQIFKAIDEYSRINQK